MIISASYKTDIPAFYADWFRNRLRAGSTVVANPYGGPPQTVSLAPADVDGFVFWTRNVEPFLPVLGEVARNVPFVVHYTITGYPRALDAGTIAPERAVAHLRDIVKRYGPRAAVWRYDPMVFSSLTPSDWHEATFARLAETLAGVVDEVVVSVAQIYRKTRRNMDTAAREHGFDWWDPDADEKRTLVARLAAIAQGNGIAFTLCGQRELLVEGVGDARCIDAERLSDVAGRPIAAVRRAHRKACGCWASKDIGGYDTCPHGCVYCYAVGSRERAKARFAEQDPAALSLGPVGKSSQD